MDNQLISKQPNMVVKDQDNLSNPNVKQKTVKQLKIQSIINIICWYLVAIALTIGAILFGIYKPGDGSWIFGVAICSLLGGFIWLFAITYTFFNHIWVFEFKGHTIHYYLGTTTMYMFVNNKQTDTKPYPMSDQKMIGMVDNKILSISLEKDLLNPS